MSTQSLAKHTYESELLLGHTYRDDATKLEGKLVAITFYEYACERATLRYLNKQGEVIEQTFDAPELTHIASGEQVSSERPGGPARADGRRSDTRRLDV